ncbi:unnamed protein product [Arctogadus glacialis]
MELSLGCKTPGVHRSKGQPQAQMSPSEMWASDRASEPMLKAPVVSRLRRLLLALPPHGNEQGGDLMLKASTTTTSVMKAI